MGLNLSTHIMKVQTKLFLLSISCGAALLTGCQTTDPQPTPAPTPAPVVQPQPSLSGGKFANAPHWVANPTVEGGLSAVGSAMPTGAGTSFQRTRALAQARDELARQMSVEVSNLFKDFTQVTGLFESETVDTVASNVSRQVAQATLAGSRQVDIWQAPDGELYVLVVMDTDSIRDAAREAVKAAASTSLGNDEALYQQFLGERAQAELDAQLEKRFPRR